MGDPTTVREWLETLPEPLRTLAISQTRVYADNQADDLIQALYRFEVWENTNEGHQFWQDVTESLTVHNASWPASYIAIAPDDLAELQRKAAAYDKIVQLLNLKP
jgi:hypothetical protein